jgi:hypothetical protein
MARKIREMESKARQGKEKEVSYSTKQRGW